MHLFSFTIKALTYTYVPVGLAHFTHSASVVGNKKTQRSLVRGRGTSVGPIHSYALLLILFKECKEHQNIILEFGEPFENKFNKTRI